MRTPEREINKSETQLTPVNSVRQQPELGVRLRALRKASGRTQADVAGDKLSVAYVSMLESGKRTPTLDVLEHLAGRLGCSVSELRGGRGAVELAERRLEISYAELALNSGEPAEALTRLAELRASTADDPSEGWRLAYLYAVALERSGDLAAAVAALEDLLDDRGEDWSTQGDLAPPVELMAAGVALARCSLELGDYASALGAAERFRSLAADQRLVGSDGYAELTSVAMMVHYLRNELSAAGQLAEELITLVDAGGSRRARGSAYWNAAGVAEARGDLPGAVALAERAVMLFAEEGDERSLARARVASAWFLLRSDPAQADDALAQLTRARAVLEDVGSRTDLAYVAVETSVALTVLGRAEEALSSADEAIALIGDTLQGESASAHLARASALIALGDDEAARTSAAHAESCLRELPSSRFTALGFRDLGQVHEALGDAALALAAYREALDRTSMTATPITAPAVAAAEPRSKRRAGSPRS
jgi:transcriptional regulator with XRE-family HTH domain